MTDHPHPPATDPGGSDTAGEVTTPHPAGTIAAAILGTGLAFVDASVVNVALPAIGGDLHADPGVLPWAVNAYNLPLGALILLGGALGDRFGRRRVFMAGVMLFLLGTLGCALAPGLATLLAARFIQGAGAAVLMPNSLAFLGAGFSGGARGRAIGTWAAVGAVTHAIGPLVGGALVDAGGWRSIFLLNLPVGAGALWLAWRYVAESRGDGPARLDWGGAALATAGLAAITGALTAAARTAHPALLGGLGGGGLVLLALFVVLERRRGDGALMPVRLFASRGYVGLTLLTLFLYAALGGLIVLLPFLLIRAAGFSAVAAGAATLPVSVLIGAGSRVMGGVAARIGGKWPLGGGAATVAIGFALLLRLDPARLSYARDLLPAILVIGAGMAVSVAPLTTAVINAVDAAHVGVASGFNSAVARVGGLIATALLSWVFVAHGSAEALVAASRTAAGVAAVLAAVAAVAAFALIPGTPPRR